MIGITYKVRYPDNRKRTCSQKKKKTYFIYNIQSGWVTQLETLNLTPGLQVTDKTCYQPIHPFETIHDPLRVRRDQQDGLGYNWLATSPNVTDVDICKGVHMISRGGKLQDLVHALCYELRHASLNWANILSPFIEIFKHLQA